MFTIGGPKTAQGLNEPLTLGDIAGVKNGDRLELEIGSQGSSAKWGIIIEFAKSNDEAFITGFDMQKIGFFSLVGCVIIASRTYYKRKTTRYVI